MTTTTITAAPAASFAFNPLDPIGSILDSALDEVQHSMERMTNSAHDAGLDVILKAAEKAAALIASLKAAYGDSLQLTYQKADKLMRDNIDRVDTLVKDIIQENQKALEKIADRVEEIVKFSPLSNWWLPLLTEVSPSFIAVDATGTTSVLVTFRGNFAYADQKGCTPSLQIGERVYKPESNTTKELKFLITIDSSDTTLQPDRVSYLRGKLSVMWHNSYIPGWNWVTSTYATLHGLLPTTVGKIAVQYLKGESLTTRTFIGPQVSFVHQAHWQAEYIKQKPSEGWHVVRGTSDLKWVFQHDDANKFFVSDDHDLVIWGYNRKDGGGIVQLYFDESQTVPASQKTEEKNDLRWGNSWIAPAPTEGEKITRITLNVFNGEQYFFFPKTDRSNPYIEIEEFDGEIKIQAKKASDLNGSVVPMAHRMRLMSTSETAK